MSYKYEHVNVARVIDGDTVVLDIDMGNRITWTAPFRLAGINAPERGHPGAEAARLYLIDLLAGGIAMAETIKPDKYGRWLVRIYINVGPDAAEECEVSARMVSAGHAVPYLAWVGQ